MTGLLAALLLAQAVQPENWINWTNYGTRGTSTVQVPLTLPLSSTGPLLPEDPGTVSHVYWDGSALVDTISNAWTMNGTVPQAAANVSPFVPGKPGAGPYSAANSYQGPTTLGEWTGDWSVTVVWKQTLIGANNEVLIAKLNAGATAGWGLLINATTGFARVYVYDGAARQTASAGLTVNGINVATFGKSGTNCYSRVNGAASATVTCGTMTAATAEPIRIGRYAAAVDYAPNTTIYEILASTTPYSDALHTQRFNAVFGLLPGPVSVTRADAITYTANGFVWSSPPATMGVGASGAEVWKGSTNYALNSAAHPKTAEATGSLNTGAHVAWHTGTGTMTVAAGTATVTGLACTAVSPGTVCTFTVTVAGTMAITTSAGTVTSAQVEPGLYPTPYIATAGTAVARAATVASVPLPQLGNKWCMSVTATPGQAWSARQTGYLWSTYTGSLPNAMNTSISGVQIIASVYDSTGGGRLATWNHTFGATTTPHRITYCNNSGTPVLCVDGVGVGTLSGAGSALQTATLTPLQLGSQGVSQFDGALSNVKVCKGATKCSDCR